MRDLLIIDFGSSTNYGDKVVGQVVRQHLANQVPGLRIRSASSVVDAETAGWWHLSPDTIDDLLDGVGCCLLLGGSIFFGQALTVRGTWWIDNLEEAGIPLLTWGGVQHVRGCYDYPDAFMRIAAASRRLFYRFEGEAEVFADLAAGVTAEWGSDPIWCRPVVSPLPGSVLATCVTAPYKCNGTDARNVELVLPLVEFLQGLEYEEHVVLRADLGVMRAEELGMEGHEVSQEHWIEHQAARAGLLVSTRLHPTLYSLLCGRPVIAADFSDKVRLLMEQVGMGRYCLALSEAEVADYWEALEALRGEDNAGGLAGRVQHCQDRARWTLRRIAQEVTESVGT